MSRKLIDEAKAKIVDEAVEKLEAQVAKTSLPADSDDISIDSLMMKGLNAINKLMVIIHTDISTMMPSRETIMNLKDCMTMLHELKKKEQDLLDNMSDEDLENLAKKDK